MGKGDKRRRRNVTEAVYAKEWLRIFGQTIECPECGEIELRPTAEGMWECDNCKVEVQF